ncbi:MAG: UDP-3-O-(3-hydroxymyristoyl)glucosamine N-acyltransferase [Oleiphilaceae bacterium]|nr:UDP-3-O-(3-hydroxymyristoyl)glucosamine N-acyltransferase [Oleiphilaceae bacterium]
MNEGNFRLRELAERVGAKIQGDGDANIIGVAKLESAGPDQLAFCASDRFRSALEATRAGAVIVKEEHAGVCPASALIVNDPYYAYAEIANLLHPRVRAEPGVHPSAVIADDAMLAEGVSVGPAAVIGEGARLGKNSEVGSGVYIGAGAVIGDDCWLAPGVYIGHNCTVGSRVMLHAGVVIGSDGFGFAPGPEGWRKVPQLGAVVLGDDVDIGANSTIDRGAIEDTIIGNGVKLDNLIQIAHNVTIGINTVMAGCTVVAGSTSIGKNCVIGGQSAITGHIDICDGVTVMGMTGVTNSIREAGVYASPIPAHPAKSWRRNVVRFMQLDDMAKRLKNLEQKLTGK